MLNVYGFAGAQWEEAKEQAKAILVGVATRRGRIAYSELVAQLTLNQSVQRIPCPPVDSVKIIFYP